MMERKSSRIQAWHAQIQTSHNDQTSSSKLLSTDLVLERILSHLDSKVLTTCRLVCHRWDEVASRVLRKNTPHGQIVIRLQAGVRAECLATQIRFFTKYGIPHTLALSLRPNPWSTLWSYVYPPNRRRRGTKQDLTRPFFSVRNKEVWFTLALPLSPFFLVVELHLEMHLRSRRDRGLFWNILTQLPALHFLRLTFPIILSHVFPHECETADLECPKAPSVRSLYICGSEGEKNPGICPCAWKGFLRGFPNLQALYVDPSHYAPLYDLVVRPLVTELAEDLAYYPFFSALVWILAGDEPSVWTDLVTLSTKLRYLSVTRVDSFDVLWSGGQLSEQLRALHLVCEPIQPPSVPTQDILRALVFPSLCNLSLCWFVIGDNLRGCISAEFISALGTLFEGDRFSTAFPALTTLAFLPLERDPGKVEEVWGTIFGTNSGPFPNIRRLSVSLGYRAGCREKRLLALLPDLFPNLSELRHFITKNGSGCRLRAIPENRNEGRDELWSCVHHYYGRPDASKQIVSHTEEFIMSYKRRKPGSDEDNDGNDLDWYAQFWDVQKGISSLTFREDASVITHPWANVSFQR